MFDSIFAELSTNYSNHSFTSILSGIQDANEEFEHPYFDYLQDMLIIHQELSYDSHNDYVLGLLLGINLINNSNCEASLLFRNLCSLRMDANNYFDIVIMNNGINIVIKDVIPFLMKIMPEDWSPPFLKYGIEIEENPNYVQSKELNLSVDKDALLKAELHLVSKKFDELIKLCSRF